METFKSYWDALKPDEKAVLSTKMDTSYMYLWQIANGYRTPSKRFSKLLRIETGLAQSAFEKDVA